MWQSTAWSNDFQSSCLPLWIEPTKRSICAIQHTNVALSTLKRHFLSLIGMAQMVAALYLMTFCGLYSPNSKGLLKDIARFTTSLQALLSGKDYGILKV